MHRFPAGRLAWSWTAYTWMVMMSRHRVVGPVAAQRDPGTRPYEIGRAVVPPEFRARPESVTAFKAVLRGALPPDLGHLILGS